MDSDCFWNVTKVFLPVTHVIQDKLWETYEINQTIWEKRQNWGFK